MTPSHLLARIDAATLTFWQDAHDAALDGLGMTVGTFRIAAFAGVLACAAAILWIGAARDSGDTVMATEVTSSCAALAVLGALAVGWRPMADLEDDRLQKSGRLAALNRAAERHRIEDYYVRVSWTVSVMNTAALLSGMAPGCGTLALAVLSGPPFVAALASIRQTRCLKVRERTRRTARDGAWKRGLASA